MIGAGVVGVTSAWYLARAGHEVTVIDRQPGPGLETSFANGGQISVSHAEPWANPHVLPKALKWLGHEDAPLLFRLRWDPALFRWALKFLTECTPARTRTNIRDIVAMALYSRQQLGMLRQETAIQYDQLTRGILHIYTDEREFEAAGRAATLMREFGCDRRSLTADACVATEPSLAAARPLLVGGDYEAADESGDAHKFTRELAALAEAKGVVFRYGLGVDRIEVEAGEAAAVIAGEQKITADAYLVACGSWSPALLAPLGISLPIYPAKGYSATLTLSEASVAPIVSLTDDGYKIVFSRLGQRLRVAGTAEFNGYNTALNAVRCATLMRRAAQLFPELHSVGEPDYWCGLRPATPSNVPLIGRTRLRNLWVNSGHGTLGWTMACGSGAAIADLISGRHPELVFPFQ